MSPTRDDVIEAVARTFPHNDPATILTLLDLYGTERHEGGREQIQLAILKLSDGDIEKLPDLVRAAKHDWRDILYWLELAKGYRDPFAERLFANLATPEATPTRLTLLKEAVPAISHVAVLGQAEYPTHAEQLRALELTAPGLAVELRAIRVRRASELDAAFLTLAKTDTHALLVLTSTMLQFNVREIAQRALTSRLPAMGEPSEFTAAGGLLSYGLSASERRKRASGFVGKLVQTLKGESPVTGPADPPKLYLTINLKSAKALGLTIPAAFLLRADEVIDERD